MPLPVSVLLERAADDGPLRQTAVAVLARVYADFERASAGTDGAEDAGAEETVGARAEGCADERGDERGEAGIPRLPVDLSQPVVERALRGARSLASAERRFLGEILYGCIRLYRQLCFRRDRAMDAGRHTRLGPAARIEALYLGYLVLAHGLPATRAAGLFGAGPGQVDFERFAAPLAALLGEIAPRRRLALEQSYPDWLVDRLERLPGAGDTAALLAAMNQRAPLCVRANRLRCTRDQLRRRLDGEGVASQPTTLARDGLILDRRINVFGLRAWRDGWLEVQDEGSQLVVEAVAAEPGATVVDACAGAGGKTLALAASLAAGQGRHLGRPGGRPVARPAARLMAIDVSETRLSALRQRARRAGLGHLVEVHRVGRAGPLPMVPASADRVLVDAPCSGVGVLRRSPAMRWLLRERDLAALPAYQLGLLQHYATAVRGGGSLVYATCSLLPEENEEVVAGFLARVRGFVAMPLRDVLGEERAALLGDGTFLRLYPHLHGTDGFFSAVLRRQ